MCPPGPWKLPKQYGPMILTQANMALMVVTN